MLRKKFSKALPMMNTTNTEVLLLLLIYYNRINHLNLQTQNVILNF